SEPETIASTGRDDDAVEWGKLVRMLGDIHVILERDAVLDARVDEIIGIAREALLTCLDALIERRFAGQPKGAAGLRLFLEYGDTVAVGDQRRIGEARRTSADHRDALALRRLRIGEQELAP